MLPGRATAESTRRFASRAPAAPGHFRATRERLSLSSLGLGTYLGEEDDATDRGFEESVRVGLSRGVNVFDSAINYRSQRSERAIGRALARAIAEGSVSRQDVFVSTKGGFLPHDSEDRREASDYVREQFFESGLLGMRDVVQGCHALAPKFLRALLAMSRANLGLETVDLYYLHNPETQLAAPREEFRRRLTSAIEFLEEAASDGAIAAWGLATWDGLRAPPNHPAHLSLTDVLDAAKEIGGDRHHFAAVQAPLNLVMPEAIGLPTQRVDGKTLPLLDAARELGLDVFTSASLLQGRLADADLPEEIDRLFADVPAGARRALQFSRSAPGVTTALVGVSNPSHAEETFSLASLPPAPGAEVSRLVRR